MQVMEKARKLGTPVKINVTGSDATTVLSGSDCLIRNIGSDDVYFLTNSSTAVTTSNGIKLAAGDTFPMIVSATSIRTISSTTSKLEVVPLT